MDRRQFLLAAAAAAAVGPGVAPAQARAQRAGHLVIIGGSEDRRGDRFVLRRFIELCAAPAPRIALITAASMFPDLQWQRYSQTFAELGARECVHVAVQSRDEADDAELADQVLGADGVFMSGGSQGRLLSVVGGSAVARAIETAYRERGACVGGTSAGAAAMSLHMLAGGRAVEVPDKDAIQMGEGLGLLPQAIVDQHFSERRRLGRLLSAVAQRPDLLGVGIDEDTALVIERGGRLQVVGAGTVTLIDGRPGQPDRVQADAAGAAEQGGVQLHVLPSGAMFELERSAGGPDARRGGSASMRDALSRLVSDA